MIVTTAKFIQIEIDKGTLSRSGETPGAVHFNDGCGGGTVTLYANRQESERFIASYRKVVAENVPFRKREGGEPGEVLEVGASIRLATKHHGFFTRTCAAPGVVRFTEPRTGKEVLLPGYSKDAERFIAAYRRVISEDIPYRQRECEPTVSREPTPEEMKEDQ